MKVLDEQIYYHYCLAFLLRFYYQYCLAILLQFYYQYYLVVLLRFDYVKQITNNINNKFDYMKQGQPTTNNDKLYYITQASKIILLSSNMSKARRKITLLNSSM